MRTALAPLSLTRPRTLAEAFAALAEAPLTPLAGGTDVYVGLNFGTLKAQRYLDLGGLRERRLRGVRRQGKGLVIGALTDFATLTRDPLVARTLPILAAAAREIGGVQIQNRATIGGNVVNASPAADAVPVLAAADATLVLGSARGERTLSLADFYLDYRKTALAPDELLLEIHVPAAPRPRFYFRKVGTRAANAIAKVVVAAVAGPAGPRIAFGSVGPTVRRVPRTEAVLAAGGSLAQAAKTLRAEIAPIDDLRSTAAYRSEVAVNLLAPLWKELR